MSDEPESQPFTKEYADYTMTTETRGGKEYLVDLVGNRWEIGRFDIPTQTYWCTRVTVTPILP